MQNKANFDMNNVKGYQSFSLGSVDNIPGIKGFFISSLKEGGQEIVQLYANNFIDMMFTGELREISWEEI